MILKNTKEVIKKSLGILWWGVTILLAIVLVNIIVSKISGKVPSAFGYSVVNIVSGSMEDEIPKDSYILIKKIDAHEVKRGDVICFYSTDPMIYGMPNTHRVVEDPIKTDEGYEFVTRGDANLIDDKVTAKGDRLIGIYVKKLDGLTAFSEFLSGNFIIFVIIGLQIAIVAMVAYSLIVVKRRGDDDEINAENSAETPSEEISKAANTVPSEESGKIADTAPSEESEKNETEQK